jgi:GTP diphosphokinase / guanosine-3',5'-bis(diphosphate) 3'-diphosphatase
MRTLHFIKKPEKRERIARETLDIYAPLARSIGMHRITTELEELAFEHLNPAAREAIGRRLAELRSEQSTAIATVSGDITARLDQHGVQARVYGREKTPFSIWRKLQRKSVGFSQLSDIYAFRVIVESVEDCYRALGVIHRIWPCVPERFKDFISVPKQNNYRSLHTTVIGPKGMRIEMQIRTEAMDRVAEEGVAAHWRYKNEEYRFDADAAKAGGRDPLANLRNLVQVLEHGGDPDDFLEHAKLEMFLDQVFVFTPKGRVISLPRGAMPLDFAYAVHTDIGDTTIGVKVNGELRPLRTPLANGDTVEVIRGAKPAVPPDWRSLTVTGKARAAIRRHLRQSEREEFIRLGKASIAQAFARAERSVGEVTLRAAVERHAKTTNEDELYEAVGRGRVTPAEVLEAVFPGLKESERAAAAARVKIESGRAGRHFIRGTNLPAGAPVRFGHCCSPVPGDRIVGLVQPEALEVHVIDCHRLAEFEDQQELWRDLQWTPEAEANTLSGARLKATIRDAPGALGQVCTIIGETGANIVRLNMSHRHSDFFDVDVDVEVVDLRHLTHLAAALRACPAVDTVDRARG